MLETQDHHPHNAHYKGRAKREEGSEDGHRELKACESRTTKNNPLGQK